jgi:hypothetical protein
VFLLLAATSFTFLAVGIFTSWLLVLQIDVPEELIGAGQLDLAAARFGRLMATLFGLGRVLATPVAIALMEAARIYPA